MKNVNYLAQCVRLFIVIVALKLFVLCRWVLNLFGASLFSKRF